MTHKQDGNQKEYLETWIPHILPALKKRWIEYEAGLSTQQSLPDLGDWLTVLHTAALAPWKLPRQLTELLGQPHSGIELQNSWIKLTNLLALTFEVAQLEADNLNEIAWQNILELQNRILQKAAHFSLVRGERPDTDTLKRRALYLQTVTNLNKKIVDIRDPDKLLYEIVATIHNELGYEYVSLFSLNYIEQSLSLQTAVWKSWQPELDQPITLKVDPEKGPVSRAAATGQIVLANELGDKTAHPDLPAFGAELVVPLLVGNKLVGVLDIGSDYAHVFTDDDRQIVRALAYQVAVAMENVRLQTVLQRHLREKTLLYESNIALGTTLDMDTVLKLMAQKIVEALDVGGCAICRVDEKAGTITAVAQYVVRYPGNPSRIWRKLEEPIRLESDPLAKKILKTSRPAIGRSDSTKNLEELVWQIPYGDMDRKNWGVVLALPMRVEHRTIGLIEVYDKNSKREFTTDDIQLGRILATQTTLAMERARLFEETRQRLDEVSTLYTLAQEISGKLDLQAVLNTIVVSLRQAIGCRGCCLFLLDKNQEQLEIQAADGLKPHWRETAKLRLGEGAAGLAALEKRTIYIPDTRKHAGFIFFDEEVRSLMVIPLLAKGEVIGTINVDDKAPDAFGPSQERLLTIAAAQAGIIIENARLFARVSAEQQRNRAIIQHMADGLLLINSEGVIVTCNHTLASMIGLHPGQIIGHKIQSANLPTNLASITVPPTEEARTGVLSMEVTIQSPHFKTLQVFSTAIVDDNKEPIGEVRIVHDITKEREIEHLKNEFISTISHELRTPLFSIQGFAKILLEETELEPETRSEFLTRIQRQAHQLSEMVSNLLDISKFDEGKLELSREPVSMRDLTYQMILKLQGFAHQQEISLESNLPPSLPPVIGDRQRLEQVLTNLIGNAIKFTEAGGQVMISATTTESEIMIEISDTGQGMPPEVEERIFSKYYHTHTQLSGSGLGLHIAKKIIDGHGGRIWAESELGQGSTFRFTLPLMELDNETTD